MNKAKYFLIFVVVILSMTFLSTMAFADWHIRGVVFKDKDCDGIKQGGEGPLKNATVTIVGPKWPSGTSQITPSDGKYDFYAKNAPGTYTITVTPGPQTVYCILSLPPLFPNPRTVIMVKKDINNVNFGASKIGVSPPSGCCP